MSTLKVSIVVGGCAMILVAIIAGIVVWRRREEYTREKFAFTALATITTLTTALFACVQEKSMPWDIIAKACGLGGQTDKLTATEYSFLFLVYMVTVYAIVRVHQQWNGSKSLEQYRREQRSEATGIIIEGFSELRRLVRRDPPFPVYTPLTSRQLLTQLEPVVDSYAWRDQARELIKLSSSTYIINSDVDWHDKEGVWVASNIDTKELVFIYPCNDLPIPEKMEELLAYAETASRKKGRRWGEFIVAIKMGSRPPVSGIAKVRYETENTLLDKLVSITDYKNEIRKRVESVCLPDSSLVIKQVYVPSRSEDESNKDVGQILQSWLHDRSEKQIALLGGYGQGKSTTALMFAYNLLTSRNDSGRIPILIELRGTSPRNLTPLQLLGAWCSQYNINPQGLLRLHIAGRLILIFEGFDEMSLVGDIEMRLKHFRTIWQFCYPNAKILITGRPNFFLDEEELKAALGIHREVAGRPYCKAVRLAPFGIKQIEDALAAHPITVRQEILAFAQKNIRFREVVSRPSLLHIVSVLWEQEKLSQKIDKLNSAFLMELFVRHSYTRQGLKESDGPDFMALTNTEREYFMRGVATFMASKQLPNQINSTQINVLIEQLINSIPDSVSFSSSAISGESTKPLRMRLSGTEHGIEHVKTDVRACGLLVDDPAAPGTFRFGHKSFMEYLFAAVLAETIQNDRPESARSILKATDADINHVLHLPVSIDFLAELLSPSLNRDGVANTNLVNNNSEIETTQRLLDLLLGGTRFTRLVARVSMFFDISNRSWNRITAHWSTPWNYIALFLPVGRLVAFIPLYLITILSTLKPTTAKFEFDSFIAAAFLSLLSYGVFFRGLVETDRLRLWNRLCKGLGIDSKSMHTVAHTQYLPWAKNQSFDYYAEQADVSSNVDTIHTQG